MFKIFLMLLSAFLMDAATFEIINKQVRRETERRKWMNEWMNECVFIYRKYHIMSHGGYNSFEWDRTSACKGASACRYQSILKINKQRI